jgi:hypothetical protein
MTRFLVIVLMTAMTALGSEVATPTSTMIDTTSNPTFHKNVLPVLQKNCQACHRDGGIAPMSFTSYESTRPWAKAIKAAVVNRKMPPWFADPHYGEFRNAPKLTDADIKTLVAWVDEGAREGEVSLNGGNLKGADGWRIQPDVVVSMPEPYRVVFHGPGEIKEFFIDNPFKEDTWVSAMEIRPSDPTVVHHAIVQIPERAQRNIPLGGSYGDIFARNFERQTGEGTFMTMEAVYAPGTPPLDFQYNGSAKLIQGKKPIRIEVHYTPNGVARMDQTQIAFTLAKAPAQRRFVMMAPEHLVDIRERIPANESNFETQGTLTFNMAADLVWLMPHMHLRGKDMTYQLIYPDGREETVLKATYNFNWQTSYELAKPIRVSKGTRLVVTAHHDNSANNKMNPDPSELVTWGEMTGQEMMLPWFGVVVDGPASPEKIATYKPGDLDGPFPMINQ